MYIAIIYGWTEVIAFGKTEKEAQKLAIKKKKEYCPDEFTYDSKWKWDWKSMLEYFGAHSERIEDGLTIVK